MKKIIAIALIATMIFSLCACGKKPTVEEASQKATELLLQEGCSAYPYDVVKAEYNEEYKSYVIEIDADLDKHNIDQLGWINLITYPEDSAQVCIDKVKPCFEDVEDFDPDSRITILASANGTYIWAYKDGIVQMQDVSYEDCK